MTHIERFNKSYNKLYCEILKQLEGKVHLRFDHSLEIRWGRGYRRIEQSFTNPIRYSNYNEFNQLLSGDCLSSMILDIEQQLQKIIFNFLKEKQEVLSDEIEDKKIDPQLCDQDLLDNELKVDEVDDEDEFNQSN